MNVPRFVRRLFRAPYDGLQHFGVVAAGTLYRCGQPTPAELTDLIARYGLRTVVSLRGQRDEDDPDAWERDERAVCAAQGVEFVTIPCNHKNPPNSAQAEQFLGVCRDPARRPVLVHCRLGQQRTLLFCALYRVHIDGLAPEVAEREMDALGFGARKRRHRKLLAAFRALARPADAPAPLLSR
ncbi:MAG TPA: tyrosine-protein phosphatase [Phycisphaerae bacterium]|nr:tyrosine-protein phosphatase [Phycisphaerae bacterium]HPM22847.1 tyrosine-protein phosphatase [Phycisphaerae bacterium]HQL53591.1 tyrosine-protein phosphatase [Phycisphaerae bacterium]